MEPADRGLVVSMNVEIWWTEGAGRFERQWRIGCLALSLSGELEEMKYLVQAPGLVFCGV